MAPNARKLPTRNGDCPSYTHPYIHMHLHMYVLMECIDDRKNVVSGGPAILWHDDKPWLIGVLSIGEQWTHALWHVPQSSSSSPPDPPARPTTSARLTLRVLHCAQARNSRSTRRTVLWPADTVSTRSPTATRAGSSRSCRGVPLAAQSARASALRRLCCKRNARQGLQGWVLARVHRASREQLPPNAALRRVCPAVRGRSLQPQRRWRVHRARRERTKTGQAPRSVCPAPQGHMRHRPAVSPACRARKRRPGLLAAHASTSRTLRPPLLPRSKGRRPNQQRIQRTQSRPRCIRLWCKRAVHRHGSGPGQQALRSRATRFVCWLWGPT